MYDVTVDFAGLTGDELVYDLYTGTCTIANYVAGSALQVIGVELYLLPKVGISPNWAERTVAHFNWSVMLSWVISVGVC